MTTPRALRLNASDNVIIAVDEFPAGAAAWPGLVARERIPRGHKMAAGPIQSDAPVRKFGQIIGFASRAIAAGEWVHEHNCAVKEFARDYHFGEDMRLERIKAVEEQPTFQGFPAAKRQNRHAQLSGDPDLSELFRHDRAPDRPRGRALGDALRLSECRRRHCAGARHRLRHGVKRRRFRGVDAHRVGLCR